MAALAARQSSALARASSAQRYAGSCASLPRHLGVAHSGGRTLCTATPGDKAAPDGEEAKAAAEAESTTAEEPEATSDATAEEPEADYAAELEARVAALEEEVKGKHDQVLRALAEADNARRRAKIDVEEAHKFAVGKFAKELLDVADNLTRAQEAVPEDMRADDDHPQLKALYEGVVMTEKTLLKTFEKHGLVKVWPLDEKFDPNLHDALFEMPDPTREPGFVGHVANAGYVLNDRCIRAAGVGVVKAS